MLHFFCNLSCIAALHSKLHVTFSAFVHSALLHVFFFCVCFFKVRAFNAQCHSQGFHGWKKSLPENGMFCVNQIRVSLMAFAFLVFHSLTSFCLAPFCFVGLLGVESDYT